MTLHRRHSAVYRVLACCCVWAAAGCDLEDPEDDETNVNVSTGSSGGGGGTRTASVSTSSDGASSSARDAGARDTGVRANDSSGDVALDDDYPLVSVFDGKLEGRLSDDGDVRSFLGIPYAEPPLGELRWAPPEAPASWPRVRVADEFGPSCAQPQLGPTFAVQGDEDCLYLNVWTPNTRQRSLPVVFFIHGGDHIYGSAAEPGPYKNQLHFDGTALAARGVVVITANYRLGALGFLAHADLDDEGSQSGNQGLLDQQFALQWIQDNVTAFGGDPDNVTVVGQGSGAKDVCLHMVSPSSKHLFAQAISQSGGCTTYQPTQRDVEARTLDWVDDVGCGTARDTLACLRDVPVKKLLAAMPTTGSPFTAIVDGTFVPDQPRVLFDAGKFSSVPYIVGSNTYEDAALVAEFSSVVTEADYHALLAQRFPDAPLDELCDIYPHDEYGNTAEAYRRSLTRIFHDAFYTCASADTAVRASSAGATVFAYDFAVSPESQESDYVFGAAAVLGSADRNLTEMVQAYWTNFASTGDPNDNQLLEWPEYAPYGTRPMDLRLTFALDAQEAATLHGHECAFWSQIYTSEFKVVTSDVPVPLPPSH